MSELDPRIVEEFDRRAPFALADATLLVLANIGSHSHGTYVPKDDPQAIDDTDFMAIVVPPASYVLGIQQWEGLNFQRDELDVVVYSFEKFIRLLLKANPNVLGMLWLAPESYVWEHALWRDVIGERTAFSSLHAYHSFIGYAHGQAQKMESFDVSARAEWREAMLCVTDMGWTRDQITSNAHREMPSRRDDGLFVTASGRFYTPEGVEFAVTSVRRIHARHFQGYMGEKRKALVERYGFDTKNAAHLIRLMRMCVEFLQTGTLQVYRTDDAEHIRAIKRGAVPLVEIKAEADLLFIEARAARDVSALDRDPDTTRADRLVQHIHRTLYAV